MAAVSAVRRPIHLFEVRSGRSLPRLANLLATKKMTMPSKSGCGSVGRVPASARSDAPEGADLPGMPLPAEPPALYDVDLLPTPASYFPIRNGRYDVRPGLMTLGTNIGQGDADKQVFPFDRRFPEFRANKFAARQDALQRYVVEGDGFSQQVRAAAVSRIKERVVAESPHLFAVDGAALCCTLTGERLILGADGQLLAAQSDVSPPYQDAFDAICCQVCEDIAVVRRFAGRGDAIVALHVCAPSGWDPAEKIGLSFDATHRVVPGMERVRAAGAGLVRAMIEQPAPTVRFNWGIQSGDDRLNAHPSRHRLDAHIAGAPAYLRTERQIFLGMPEVDAALFTIRVIHTPLAEIRRDPRRRAELQSALLSMSEETRRYKGLAGKALEDTLRQIESP